MTAGFRSALNRIQLASLVAGILALAASVFGAFANPRQFFFSYLFAVLFWLGLSLGCFVVTMIHQLAGGRWGYPTRRFLEAGFMVLPLMAALSTDQFRAVRDRYRAFLDARHPTERQKFAAQWEVESLQALLWALGRVEVLPPPDVLCDARSSFTVMSSVSTFACIVAIVCAC